MSRKVTRISLSQLGYLAWYDGDAHEPLSEKEFEAQYKAGRRKFRKEDIPSDRASDDILVYEEVRRIL